MSNDTVTASTTSDTISSTISTTDTGNAVDEQALSQERRDILEALRVHRQFLIQTTVGITEEQARQRSTVSALSLGGLIKHVADVEDSWARYATDGPEAMSFGDDVDWSAGPPAEAVAAYEAGFVLQDDETLAGWLDEYAAVAARTDALVASLDLDAVHPLPEAPWFEPGGTRSVRRVFMHIIAETAQHAGHADIIRETIDGARTMG